MTNPNRDISTFLSQSTCLANRVRPEGREMVERLSNLTRDLESVLHEVKQNSRTVASERAAQIRNMRAEFGFPDPDNMPAMGQTSAQLNNFGSRSSAPIVHSEIGKKLRSLYTNVVEEELPSRFRDLLNQMAAGPTAGAAAV